MKLLNRIRVLFGREPKGPVWDAYRRATKTMELSMEEPTLSVKKQEGYLAASLAESDAFEEMRMCERFMEFVELVEKENAVLLRKVVCEAASLVTRLERSGIQTKEFQEMFDEIKIEPSSLRATCLYEKMLKRALEKAEESEHASR